MTKLTLDTVEITYEGGQTVYIDVYDNSLARRWLPYLNQLLQQGLHLEKNFCFLGWPHAERNGDFLLAAINRSIVAINTPGLLYKIDLEFTKENSIDDQGGVNHAQFNLLHQHFEHLQGTAARPSPLYAAADAVTRWHIRQLNLLCHEFESWQLSHRKLHTAPEWIRPSQLMCWLNAPRFALEPQDLDLFGVDTINRDLGGVYVGVNKAVGKHHWEVFSDEGSESRLGELTTTVLEAQTLACGDFDIEWGRNPGAFAWQQQQLARFRQWLEANGWDPEDPSLTIGHPKIGQVDLVRSFGTEDYATIWARLNTQLNVRSVRTSTASAQYPYSWADADYAVQQQRILK